MQSNAPIGQQNDQQPALPSYAEAMRTAAPPNFPQSYTIGQETFHSSAPVHGPQSVPVHTQYNINQPIYTQMPTPVYTTNAYPQYGQTAADLEGPTTIHIIRPVSTEQSTCCRGTSGRLLGIVLGIVIVGAILRATLNSRF